MKYVQLVLQILLGAAFVVFGLNFFLDFMPKPEMNKMASDFFAVMVGSGYMGVVKVLEILGGLLLLSGRFSAAGLVVLTPIIVNIVLFHVYIQQDGLEMALAFLAIDVVLIAAQWHKFKSILR
ncbi:MAG: hypothetical protein LW884_08935 [Bacteroidetes bacterium]|jgi:putative oxidoreductase|nr:hypothetical protein [Bacteroidota bacterium]